MTVEEIKDLLPNPDNSSYEKIKTEHPYNILLKYAQAFDAKYPNKLGGVVTEASGVNNETPVSFALYIVAAIGTGYSYRLLELTPLSANIYPLGVKVFEQSPHDLPQVESPLDLEKRLQEVLKSAFTQTLVLNLLAQIELYNESRKE
jgi:hypothetical protein